MALEISKEAYEAAYARYEQTIVQVTQARQVLRLAEQAEDLAWEVLRRHEARPGIPLYTQQAEAAV
jgi:hypothetical protein